MNESQRALTKALLFEDLPEEQFLARFGTNIKTDPSMLQHELENALVRQDGEDVQWALALGFRFGTSPAWAPILCQLLDADWHVSHEDIASTLQALQNPSTVDCLYRTAQRRLPYLEYDDSAALARLCIWALHDIGTADAIAKLEALAASETEPRTGYAKKRLAAIAARGSKQGPDR